MDISRRDVLKALVAASVLPASALGAPPQIRGPVSAERTILYGKRRCSGTLIYIDSHGGANEILTQVLLLPRGTERLLSVFVNGLELKVGRSTITRDGLLGLVDVTYPVLPSKLPAPDGREVSLPETIAEDLQKALVKIDFRYQEGLLDSMPKTEFLVQGRSVYDPRG